MEYEWQLRNMGIPLPIVHVYIAYLISRHMQFIYF
jgi:predicted nucleotide-binding protein (sugar kinase/HSP70/actin superfamily)